MRCHGAHVTNAPEATGRIRYVEVLGRGETREVIGSPICDVCQASGCTSLRPAERAGQVRELGAVPLDYAERLSETRRSGAARRIADEIKAASGTQDEIADMIVSALDALPRDARHYAMKSVVLGRLQRWAAEQDEGAATMRAEIDPDEVPF